ncbi:MAG: hypothetical protein FH762_17185 [Firmicutes bacterium]|nr:hypothetical protein [Bacillota bacterium]MTI61691.1 hypothetical protein [Bacillota bacterium]
MISKDKWEPCPKCGSKKVVKPFYSMTVVGLAIIALVYFFPGLIRWTLESLKLEILFRHITLLGYTLGGFFFIIGLFTTQLKCKDCNKVWIYKKDKNKSNNQDNFLDGNI